MNYIAMAGIIESNSKNPQHWEHVREFVMLGEQMIRDLVPQLLKEELARTYLDLLVKIQTQLNGRDVDFPDVIEYIKSTIEAELQKALR